MYDEGGEQMSVEEMQQNTKTIEQIIDDLMSMVFDENIPATELLLKIILKRDDITVISVVGQREFQNPVVGGRDIRLDILAKDSMGKYYNIEVQKGAEGAHVRRARFNSSMMDSRMLKAGQEFSELRDSYMIFITHTDIFGYGIPIYTVNRYFEEIDIPFNDGSHIVYVNGSYKGEDAIGKLMHDFRCKDSRDMYYSELVKGMKNFKEEEGGRKIMCEAVEKYAESYAEKYAEKVRLNSLLDSIKKMMTNLKIEAEQAMNVLEINDSDREILQKRLR